MIRSFQDKEAEKIFNRERSLMDDLHDATVLQLTAALISQAVKLLDNNVLHAMDALHVACAIEWNAEFFITSDRRGLDAAVNSGLQTKYLGQPIA